MSDRVFKSKLETTALTLEEAWDLLKFGDAKVRQEVRALLRQNGHRLKDNDRLQIE